MSAAITGPLAGVRVLDLTSVVMGPLATQILGDLGADVVTVEHERGDTNRHMSRSPHPHLSGQSLNLLRNKRNIVLDLRSEAGREVFLRLAADADVLVTNLRPGPLSRLRLDEHAVRAVNESIIYCQAAGFPSESERADRPAYDDVIQAASGLADAQRLASGEPGLAPTILADKVCGLTIAYSVLAALVHRARTGEGQRVEVPMIDVMQAFMLVEHGSGAIPVPPSGPPGYARILTPNRKPQRTADGWIHIMAYEPHQFDALFAAAGRDDLVGHPSFATRADRLVHADFLYAQIHALTPSRTTEEWLEFCRVHEIPVGPVSTLEEITEALPEADHPHAGRYRVIPPPVRYSRSPASVRLPAPLIGEHTREILAELGYAESQIDAMLAAGVAGIGGADD